jgi:CubicO group peptidase (beta-lactamase class C family)
MRNLVCACTGVPRRDPEFLFNANSLTAEDIVDSLRGFDIVTAFGEAYQYSNQMVASGGYIAGLAGSGRTDDLYSGYLEQMQQRVFDPIGMSHTTFSFEEATASPDYATPHGQNVIFEYGPVPVSHERTLIPLAPAGGSWSNARDMARYLITELNEGVSLDGVRVVSAENLGSPGPQVPVDAVSSYGLGWFVDKYKGLQLLHHGGNTLGFTTDLAFLPQADLGIVVLANARASDHFNQAVRFRLFELAFEQPSWPFEDGPGHDPQAKPSRSEQVPSGPFAMALGDIRCQWPASSWSAQNFSNCGRCKRGGAKRVRWPGPGAAGGFEFSGIQLRRKATIVLHYPRTTTPS